MQKALYKLHNYNLLMLIKINKIVYFVDNNLQFANERNI